MDKPNGKTDDVLDAEFWVELKLRYNIKTGQFQMGGNVRDEVITMGMLDTAKTRMMENYNAARFEQMKAEADGALLTAPPGLKVQ